MPKLPQSLSATIAGALDRIAPDVMRLAALEPRMPVRALADAVFRLHALRVEPDNLRMWLRRRQVADFRSAVTPAIRCPLDDHLDVVDQLRADGYTWPQVLECLRRVDPALDYTAGGLRVWHSRRAARASRLADASTRAAAGVQLMRTPVTSTASVSPARPPGPAEPTDARSKALAELEVLRLLGHGSDKSLAAALASAGIQPDR